MEIILLEGHGLGPTNMHGVHDINIRYICLDFSGSSRLGTFLGQVRGAATTIKPSLRAL